ncbi:CoA ester lyase [Plantibacter sp. VKM Ac-2880]|uniref:HpcH/HpaI aldolase/citrate lyase family protein n=1 Tax=Plantibacter sp. VKM Ac-2880 TaxID=2783827 RepID=UPI00188E8B99|nr:CoA ester lyase [Plantibacter sp. VKM Ac-2880]MBF4569587.1 CoA ester lyase [Plantibacter sp. VKM Ac-2880]
MTAAPLSLGPAILFVPADRPDRFAKAADRADTVILDLEDAVAPADKPAARRAIVEHPLDPVRTIVRVDPVGTDEFAADVAAVSSTRYRTVMLAKTETSAQLDELADAIPGVRILALCETAAGVVRAPVLAGHPSVVGLMWGSEDLVASLGGTSSRREDGGYRDVVRHARSSVLLAAGAAGVMAVDAVRLDLDDLPGLAAEAADAAAVGFVGSACIHPGQVATIRAAFRPDARAVAAARSLLEAAAGERGVFRHEGRMVDEPLLRHARSVLARAGTPVDGR